MLIHIIFGMLVGASLVLHYLTTNDNKKSEDIMKRHFHLPLHMKISQRDAKFIANCVVKEIDNLTNFE